MPVAALVGAKEHALRQVAAGVDILVVQGTEAGGHCGEVSTMVLVPEVIKAIKPIRDVPVLAAGGIMTGRQMAACMAMGAAGVWTGSVWLATVESETSGNLPREDDRGLLARRHPFQGPHRKAGTAIAFGMDRCVGSWPRQSRRAADAAAEHHQPRRLQFIDRSAAAGNTQARDLVSYFVGQGVGLIDSVKSAGAVVQEFKEDFVEAIEHMNALVEE